MKPEARCYTSGFEGVGSTTSQGCGSGGCKRLATVLPEGLWGKRGMDGARGCRPANTLGPLKLISDFQLPKL